MMKKYFAMLISCCLFVSTFAGCANVKTKVAYTVYPIGFLVDRLSSGQVQNESIQTDEIVQRATIKDNYKEILEDSAIFMHIGDLEPYLGMYKEDITNIQETQLDLSIMNAVYSFERYTEVITDGESTFIETPYYKGDAFKTIDIDNRDLYLWLDPIAMLSMAKDVRSWLDLTFPDDAKMFQENFTKLETDLINLDAQYQAMATSNEANNRVIRFVSMTASFGNWQKTYGIQVYPAILSKYGALPNKDQLELIEQRIKNDGVKYIVYEPNMSEDMIALFDHLEEDLGLTRVELSNLSSLTQEDIDSGKDYLSIMYENLSTLQTMAEDRDEVQIKTAKASKENAAQNETETVDETIENTSDIEE